MDVQNFPSDIIETDSKQLQGPTNKGLRTHSFLIPSGNRIQNLQLQEEWIGNHTVCKQCKLGHFQIIKEVDIEGLSSSIIWGCLNCNHQTVAPTSPKVKFTGLKGEKPKSTINLQAVGGIMMGGATFKTMESVLGSMDIPCMVHRTFDKNAKYFGNASVKLAVETLESNAKLEGKLAEQHGAILDGLNRIPITVSFDGNWAKRSYRHSYNSLLGGGWMFGFYSQQPVAHFVLNKYCAVCVLNGKHSKDHECSKNWNKSAKSMEAEIAVKCSLLLAKIGFRIMTIIGDEDATVLSQMKTKLPDDLPGTGTSLCDVIKLSDTNHIKKILTKDLREIWTNKWKSNGLTENGINHLVYNFGYALKGNKNDPERLGEAINNIVPHAFGDHKNCHKIEKGDWCKANNSDYVPNLPGGKYLGYNMKEVQKHELFENLQIIMRKFTTSTMLQKLAPCASSQQNESIHGMVGALASKRLFFGRSHQWRYRNSMAGLSKSLGPSYGLQIFDRLNISHGINMKIHSAKLKVRAAYHQLHKKKSEVKIRRNKLKTLRKQSGKNQEAKEGIQYESGCGITELGIVNEKIQQKRKKDENDNFQVKKRKTGTELNLARKYLCSCGKGYTTTSNLTYHKKQKNHK
jgi:hypothetical protein